MLLLHSGVEQRRCGRISAPCPSAELVTERELTMGLELKDSLWTDPPHFSGQREENCSVCRCQHSSRTNGRRGLNYGERTRKMHVSYCPTHESSSQRCSWLLIWPACPHPFPINVLERKSYAVKAGEMLSVICLDDQLMPSSPTGRFSAGIKVGLVGVGGVVWGGSQM